MDKENIDQEVLNNFNKAQDYIYDTRKQCIEDRRFVSISGAMWEGKFGSQFENKPKLEVNKIEIALIRIYNEYRNNRITVDYTNEFGEKEDFASLFDGIYRGAEKYSDGENAYDNAFEEGVAGGFGAWRLTHCEDDYNDEDEEERQVIKIQPIFDADTNVIFDPSAKCINKSDATYCFILHLITKEKYEEDYPDTPISSFPKGLTGDNFSWVVNNGVYIAEYFKVVEKKYKKYIYRNLIDESLEEKITENDIEKNPNIRQDLLDKGYELYKIINKKKKKIHKYIVSGSGVIEDCGIIAGSEIPVIPFYAKRFFIDGVERCHGHVRLCKDVSRLKNMVISKLAEFSSVSATEKPIFHEEQIANHSQQWAEANVKNYAYLTISSVSNANGVDNFVSGPLGYTKPADLPPVLSALMQQIEYDLSEILGNQSQGDKMVSNISNDAIESIQERLDKQAYIYISNFAKAMRRSGEVFLSMAKEIYIEEDRELIYVDEIGNSSKAVLNTEKIEDGEYKKLNHIDKAKFRVGVSVGASSDSKQQKNNKKLLALLPLVQQSPETVDIISSMLMMNTDFEGSKGINAYYRKKLVMSGVIEPNDEEKEMIKAMSEQPKTPTPQDQYMLAEAQKAQVEAQSQAQKTQLEIQQAQIDALKTQTEIENKQADTYKKIAEVDQKERQNYIQSQSLLNKNSLQKL